MPAIDQELRERELLVHDRHGQRRGIVDVAVIDVHAGVEHHACAVDVSFAGRKQER